MAFNHEKLIVYQKSLDFNRAAHKLIVRKEIKGDLRDQLSRASHSIALNIAEGNGKRSKKDRAYFLNRAHSSGTECAGCLGLMVTEDKITKDEAEKEKEILEEIVRMLSRMSDNLNGDVVVQEEGVVYGRDVDYKTLEEEIEREEDKE